MLSRARHGFPALYSNIFRIFIASPFFSNPNPNSPKSKYTLQNPKHTTEETTSITGTNFRYELSASSPEVSKISDDLSPTDVNSICSILSNHTTGNSSLDSLLSNFKDKLSSELVLLVLKNYRQLGRTKTLEFFSWAGLQMGFQLDDSVIEYMADFLGRRKLFDDLKCFLITVSLNNCPVSCRTLSICIRFLGRQGRIKEALCLFEEMESKFNCKPDNLVYNNMLYVLCKKEASGRFIDVAMTIFQQIESPDTYSYSNILVGLCKFGRFETALEFFHEMGRAGLVPTRSAINVLIGEMCLLSAKEGAIEKLRVNDCRRPFTILVPNVGSKSGAILPATGVFLAVHDLGLLPSAFVINRLISELCRLGKMEKAVRVLKVVEERKQRCVEEYYTIVILALCEHRWVDEVSHLFGRMLSLNFKPKLIVYNSIICMLCKLGSIDEAKRVFKIMNKKRCLPDNVTYTALIHACGEVQNWEEAYSLSMEMLGLGLYPHFHTYSLVDKLLRENGQVDLSTKLEGKMEAQMLLKHCKVGQLEAAYEKLRLMLEKGIHPPVYIREAFERAFEKAGKLKVARELLERTGELVCSTKETTL
ncbi:hypothetical protein F0562_006089 [Nyssa sinensis]|uniref:Pentacotripeptide-repeat region of PRORP domain-containing protein n=1 Tax=Nyssa sinensis TaxID=561372 RepID=A0A5J5AL02_9ASTE|nr:hypothetical protein F0562_006089 [Nyssa sinensis]